MKHIQPENLSTILDLAFIDRALAGRLLIVSEQGGFCNRREIEAGMDECLKESCEANHAAQSVSVLLFSIAQERTCCRSQ